MIVVADNLRITLPAIRQAVERLEAGPVRQVASACRDAGAQAIDINSGPLSRQAQAQMTFLIETVQAASDLPLVLDTTNPVAMAAGLALCRRRATINGISLEPRKLACFLPLAKRFECDLVGYLLQPGGQVPADAAGRMEAAVALFGECRRAGIDPRRLIIDPIVAPLAWQDGNRQNMAVLEVIQALPDLLGFPVRTMAGLSNLTTGAPDRDTRHRYQMTFLPMLAAAGLDMLLMNVLDPGLMRVAHASRNITSGQIFNW
jgi:5-methyltetrahydrofolate corrinoid/iron sulfur protein methyltransferase